MVVGIQVWEIFRQLRNRTCDASELFEKSRLKMGNRKWIYVRTSSTEPQKRAKVGLFSSPRAWDIFAGQCGIARDICELLAR